MFLFNTNINPEHAFLLSNYDSELSKLNNDTAIVYYDSKLPKMPIGNIWECYKPANKANTVAVLLQEELNEKWIRLYQSFAQSFKEKKDTFSDIPFDRISDDFKFSLREILSLYPAIITVGISDDECIFIYAEFDDKSVFFDLFFDTNDPTEALLNISENKKIICSYSNNIDRTLLKLKEFVQSPNYELSYLSTASYQ
jgi:hypothetical protein